MSDEELCPECDELIDDCICEDEEDEDNFEDDEDEVPY